MGRQGCRWNAHYFRGISGGGSRTICRRFTRPHFRTLVAANYSPFPAPFQPPPRGPDIIPNLADSHPRLAIEKGSPDSSTDFPRFPPDCAEIAANQSTSQETPFRELIEDKDPPNLGPYHPHGGGRIGSGNGESIAALRGRSGVSWAVGRLRAKITRYRRCRQQLVLPTSKKSPVMMGTRNLRNRRNRRNRAISGILNRRNRLISAISVILATRHFRRFRCFGYAPIFGDLGDIA